EHGVPLQAEQADWLADTDEEINEQELEAHYSFMAKIQEVLPKESSSTEQPLEQVQNNDENNVFSNERQHSENNTAECDDERAALANLIANLTLDTEENKIILKQLKKANASLTQELEECKTNLDETSRALGEATRVNHTTSVSRPQFKYYQVKDKVVPNNSQVKFKNESNSPELECELTVVLNVENYIVQLILFSSVDLDGTRSTDDGKIQAVV
ncbi:hypothetical protein Tco_0867050, partial [Tanacetum coccineum]